MLGIAEAVAAQLDRLPCFSIPTGHKAAAIVGRGMRAGIRAAPSPGGGGGGQERDATQGHEGDGELSCTFHVFLSLAEAEAGMAGRDRHGGLSRRSELCALLNATKDVSAGRISQQKGT